MSDAYFLRKSLLVLGGLIVWAAHFAFVYGFNTMACARQFSVVMAFGVDIVTLTVSAATILAISTVLALALLALWRRGPAIFARDRKPVDDFLRYTTIAIALLSLIAILWTGLPVFVVQPCG